jgi:hypothetical protein
MPFQDCIATFVVEKYNFNFFMISIKKYFYTLLLFACLTIHAMDPNGEKSNDLPEEKKLEEPECKLNKEPLDFEITLEPACAGGPILIEEVLASKSNGLNANHDDYFELIINDLQQLLEDEDFSTHKILNESHLEAIQRIFSNFELFLMRQPEIEGGYRMTEKRLSNWLVALLHPFRDWLYHQDVRKAIYQGLQELDANAIFDIENALHNDMPETHATLPYAYQRPVSVAHIPTKIQKYNEQASQMILASMIGMMMHVAHGVSPSGFDSFPPQRWIAPLTTGIVSWLALQTDLMPQAINPQGLSIRNFNVNYENEAISNTFYTHLLQSIKSKCSACISRGKKRPHPIQTTAFVNWISQNSASEGLYDAVLDNDLCLAQLFLAIQIPLQGTKRILRTLMNEYRHPLSRAIYQKNLPLTKLLLQYAIDFPSDAIPSWNTLLHHAARVGFLDILEALVAWGADINAYNENNETPLQVAIECSEYTTAHRLLDLGANPHQAHPSSHNALKLANNKLMALIFHFNGLTPTEGIIKALIKKIQACPHQSLT